MSPDGDKQMYQVTEVTPVGFAYVVLQLYIEGSVPQVDITNPNPPDTPGNPAPEPTEEELAKSAEKAKELNR